MFGHPFLLQLFLTPVSKIGAKKKNTEKCQCHNLKVPDLINYLTWSSLSSCYNGSQYLECCGKWEQPRGMQFRYELCLSHWKTGYAIRRPKCSGWLWVLSQRGWPVWVLLEVRDGHSTHGRVCTRWERNQSFWVWRGSEVWTLYSPGCRWYKA